MLEIGKNSKQSKEKTVLAIFYIERFFMFNH